MGHSPIWDSWAGIEGIPFIGDRLYPLKKIRKTRFYLPNLLSENIINLQVETTNGSAEDFWPRPLSPSFAQLTFGPHNLLIN